MAKFVTAKFRPRINLKKFFTKEATKNIIGKPRTSFPTYKSLMNKKKGIRLDKAPRNSPTTIAMKGKDHWLVDTGETMNNGFKFTAKARSLRVYASTSKHSQSNKTYKQIFEEHNAERYSGVFQKLPVGSKFPERMVREVGKQIMPQLTRYLKRNLRKR